MAPFRSPFIVYAVVLALSLFIPASEGYAFITWKLLIGQIYAIPAFILTWIFLTLRKRTLLMRYRKK